MFSAITQSLPNPHASAFTSASLQPTGGQNLFTRIEGARRAAMENQVSWSIDSMEGDFYFDSSVAVFPEDESTQEEMGVSRVEIGTSSAEAADEEFQSLSGACSPLLEEEETAGAKSKRIMDFTSDNDISSIIYLLEFADEEVKKLLEKNEGFMNFVAVNRELHIPFFKAGR